MKTMLLSLLILLVSCSKQDLSTTCDLTGTWQQQIQSPDGRTLPGFTLTLNPDGTMMYNEVTGYLWHGDCTYIDYIFKQNKGFYIRLEILKHESTQMIIRYAPTNLATNPFFLDDSITLIKIK